MQQGARQWQMVADLAAEFKEGLLAAKRLREVALLLGKEPHLMLTRTLRCICCTFCGAGLASLQTGPY